MRNFRIFTSSILLATMPTTFVYPQIPTSFPVEEQVILNHNSTPTYDDIIRLLSAIESGELEGRCTQDELERIEHFLVYLAKIGALPDGSEEKLDADIATLLHGNDNMYGATFAFAIPGEYQATIVPAILHRPGQALPCKGWFSKTWKSIKHFCSEHKTAILIGGGVVVAAGAVVTAIVLAPVTAVVAAVGAVGGAVAQSGSAEKPAPKEAPPPVPIEQQQPLPDCPMLQSMLNQEIFQFKERLVQNEFFVPQISLQNHALPWEEQARVFGSVFAHDSYKSIHHTFTDNPSLSNIPSFNLEQNITAPREMFGHITIDQKFGTDHAHLFMNQHEDFATSVYHARADKAQSLGYYQDAVHDYGKVIEANPANPIPYLDRGVANFNLGHYDDAIADYHQFAMRAEPPPFSLTDYGRGFVKGLPNGIYESGAGQFWFLVNCVAHPIHTARQMVEAVSLLVQLAGTDQWATVAEAVAPELHQLITQWDVLSSEQKGELSGHILGKYGMDLLTPAVLVKAARVGVECAAGVSSAMRNIQTAQKTLILETAAGVGSGAKVGEIVREGERIAFFADELGLSGSEVGQLKQVGELENALVKNYEHLSPSVQQSITLHQNAQEFLKPHSKKIMTEEQCRNLIHQTGIQTFSKPHGVPENFLVMISNKGAGMEYVHPTNPHIRIRVMPGKLHSQNICQQRPYVIQKTDAGALDKTGKLVPPDSPEAHIPLEEFVYRSYE